MKSIALTTLIVAILSIGTAFSQSYLDTTPAGSQTKKNKRNANNTELNTPVTGVTSDFQMRRNYEFLLQKKSELSSRIEMMTSQLNTVKRSKVRKMQKELTALQKELDITVRHLATYPPSFIDPSINQARQDEATAALNRQMEQKAEQKIAEIDMDAAALDGIDDPEIKRAYQKYQKYGDIEDEVEKPALSVYFAIQVASGRANLAHTIKGVGEDVQEVKLSNGSVYVAGQYATLDEAKSACQRIKTNSRYKDAYVVAFSGKRKIPVSEAQHLLGNR